MRPCVLGKGSLRGLTGGSGVFWETGPVGGVGKAPRASEREGGWLAWALMERERTGTREGAREGGPGINLGRAQNPKWTGSLQLMVRGQSCGGGSPGDAGWDQDSLGNNRAADSPKGSAVCPGGEEQKWGLFRPGSGEGGKAGGRRPGGLRGGEQAKGQVQGSATGVSTGPESGGQWAGLPNPCQGR